MHTATGHLPQASVLCVFKAAVNNCTNSVSAIKVPVSFGNPTKYLLFAMPLTAQKCLPCRAQGRDVWTLTGRMCPLCFNVSEKTDKAYIHAPEQEIAPTTVPLTVNGDSVWAGSTPEEDFLPVVDQATVSRNQCLYVPRHGEAEVVEWEAKNSSRNGMLQILIRVTELNSIPLTYTEAQELGQEWALPSEWLEKPTGGRYLDRAWCTIRLINGFSHLHVHESVNTCFVLSAGLHHNGCVRGFWLTQDPCVTKTDGGLHSAVGDSIAQVLQQVKSAAELAAHPLLLPVLFIEARLQAAEQISEDTSSGSKQFQTSSQDIETKSLDLPSIEKGVDDAHLEVSIMSKEINSIKIMLRAMETGIDLLRQNEFYRTHEQQGRSALETRFQCIQGRVIALETKLKPDADSV
ncbi:hypothetical protein EG327_010220 [Venturia inaequalis]|uniref:Uncharacterized protein n=1 Tax=Venturia inaequalis TaxID=5025 RepID=A0A8H3YUR0_VENIN|nr:hypothetical protein EG327_010220 [Venturia inaequalis]